MEPPLARAPDLFRKLGIPVPSCTPLPQARISTTAAELCMPATIASALVERHAVERHVNERHANEKPENFDWRDLDGAPTGLCSVMLRAAG